jgi:LacI family transcriptional regulator
MAKRVSIKDIATKVGVSTALVSYVLNGLEKEKRVGKEVVEKVKKAAEELNYRPNQIARSLRKGSTNTIGLIVADIANPFFGHLARIIEDEASKFNYVVILGSSDEDYSKSESLVETFLNRQVDGFILVPSVGDDVLVRSLIHKEVPLVLIDRHFPDIASNYVILDNQKATFEATIHLINKGYRKINLVAYQSTLNHMQDRILGYREAMKSKNLEEFIHLEPIEFNQTGYERRMDEIILRSETEAILFTTNTLSIAGLYAIRRNNLKIPEDLAIIGFDGNEAFDFFIPPLTYIEQPLAEIGKEAVRILLEQIKGNGETFQLKLNHRLIVRPSSG